MVDRACSLMSEISDSLPAKVEPGVYSVMLHHYETGLMFQGKAPKLLCWFTILDQCEYNAVQLPRYYNVKRIIGRPQPGGRFVATPTGDFAREFYALFQYGGTRLDRLPMSLFDGKTIKARVALVTHARKKPIPEPLQYSKISELIKVIEE